MTIVTKGMGAIIKGGKRIKGKLGIKKRPRPGNIQSRLAKSKKKTDAEEHFDTVYKKDKTGKKDKIIAALNAQLKKNPKQFPKLLDAYTNIMGSDFAQKTGPYFKKLKKENEERRLRNLAKKKDKDK